MHIVMDAGETCIGTTCGIHFAIGICGMGLNFASQPGDTQGQQARPQVAGSRHNFQVASAGMYRQPSQRNRLHVGVVIPTSETPCARVI